MDGEKNKGGRPQIVFDDQKLDQIENLAAVFTMEQIADFYGISRTTLAAIMERQPEFSERYKKGRAAAIGKIAQSLVQKAASGDTACMMVYLKTQAGWKETQVVDNTSSDGSMTPRQITRVIIDHKKNDEPNH